jgi:hydroxylamine reductase (hybrid-cluster protein)
MTVAATLRFKFDGEEYDFMTSLKVKDAIFLKEKCGATTATVVSYLDRRDPETIVAVAFLHRRAAGKAEQYESLLEKDVMSFDWLATNIVECSQCAGRGITFTEVGKAEEEQEQGEDPTTAGKTRKAGTSKTGSS